MTSKGYTDVTRLNKYYVFSHQKSIFFFKISVLSFNQFLGKVGKKVISNFDGLKIRKSFNEHSRLELKLNIDLVITLR